MARRAADARAVRRRRRTVVTASTGNHGAATAWAAGQLGIRAIVFVPEQRSATKLALIASARRRDPGGGTDMDEAKDSARARRPGAACRSSRTAPSRAQYEGYAAIGDEILDQLDEPPAAVVVPVGNGALLGGIGRAISARSPETLRDRRRRGSGAGDGRQLGCGKSRVEGSESRRSPTGSPSGSRSPTPWTS